MLLNEPSLYLASQSLRRQQLLSQIGVSHQIINVPVAGVLGKGEAADSYVKRLACDKAIAGLAAVETQGLKIKPVLGADTIVVKNGYIFEKPHNADHAAFMLSQLSGTTHQVVTAVALATPHELAVRLSVTDVMFRALSEAEIAAYWDTGEPQGKSGGYAIQGLGAVFVTEIRGSYTGVVGLPVEQTVDLLRYFNVPWWQHNSIV